MAKKLVILALLVASASCVAAQGRGSSRRPRPAAADDEDDSRRGSPGLLRSARQLEVQRKIAAPTMKLGGVRTAMYDVYKWEVETASLAPPLVSLPPNAPKAFNLTTKVTRRRATPTPFAVHGNLRMLNSHSAPLTVNRLDVVVSPLLGGGVRLYPAAPPAGAPGGLAGSGSGSGGAASNPLEGLLGGALGALKSLAPPTAGASDNNNKLGGNGLGGAAALLAAPKDAFESLLESVGERVKGVPSPQVACDGVKEEDAAGGWTVPRRGNGGPGALDCTFTAWLPAGAAARVSATAVLAVPDSGRVAVAAEGATNVEFEGDDVTAVQSGQTATLVLSVGETSSTATAAAADNGRNNNRNSNRNNNRNNNRNDGGGDRHGARRNSDDRQAADGARRNANANANANNNNNKPTTAAAPAARATTSSPKAGQKPAAATATKTTVTTTTATAKTAATSSRPQQAKSTTTGTTAATTAATTTKSRNGRALLAAPQAAAAPAARHAVLVARDGVPLAGADASVDALTRVTRTLGGDSTTLEYAIVLGAPEFAACSATTGSASCVGECAALGSSARFVVEARVTPKAQPAARGGNAALPPLVAAAARPTAATAATTVQVGKQCAAPDAVEAAVAALPKPKKQALLPSLRREGGAPPPAWAITRALAPTAGAGAGSRQQLTGALPSSSGGSSSSRSRRAGGRTGARS